MDFFLEPLYQLDAFILSGFTRFSHWFQKLTGRTNYFLAKIGFVLGSVMTFLAFANWWHQFLVEKPNPVDPILYILISCLWFWDAYFADSADQQARESQTRAKPFGVMRITPFLRLGFLMLSLFSIGYILSLYSHAYFFLLEVLRNDYGIALTVYAYFMSVDPLPPGTSKVREWLEKFHKAVFREPAYQESQ